MEREIRREKPPKIKNSSTILTRGSFGTVRRIKKQGGKGNWIQPNRRRDWKERRIRNSSKAMTELLQLQRIRLTRSSGRVKEGLLITSRNTLLDRWLPLPVFIHCYILGRRKGWWAIFLPITIYQKPNIASNSIS